MQSARPFAKSMGMSATIGFLGDASAQWSEGISEWDGRRTAAMTIFNAFYVGMIYAKLFPMMDRMLSPARLRCGPKSALVAKVLFENLLHTPFVYFPCFYVATGLLRGKPLRQIRTEASEQFVKSNVANCVLWIPATAVCFAAVPVQHRVLFFNMVSFCWQNIISRIANAKQLSQTETQCLSNDKVLHIDSLESQKVANVEQRRTKPAAAMHRHQNTENLMKIRQEISDGGDKLDAIMMNQYKAVELEEVKKYREQYRAFRTGAAHGCSSNPTLTVLEKDNDVRSEYRQFRVGKPHGCRSYSNHVLACA